jgi:hypothetical protein
MLETDTLRVAAHSPGGEGGGGEEWRGTWVVIVGGGGGGGDSALCAVCVCAYVCGKGCKQLHVCVCVEHRRIGTTTKTKGRARASRHATPPSLLQRAASARVCVYVIPYIHTLVHKTGRRRTASVHSPRSMRRTIIAAISYAWAGRLFRSRPLSDELLISSQEKRSAKTRLSNVCGDSTAGACAIHSHQHESKIYARTLTGRGRRTVQPPESSAHV